MDLYFYHNLLHNEAVNSVLNNNAIQAQRLLFNFAEYEAFTKDIFREYVIKLLFEDINTFSVSCSKNRCNEILLSFAKEDINAIFKFINYPLFPPYNRNAVNKMPFSEYQISFGKLMEVNDENSFLTLLIEHYERFGCGEYSKYTAFRYSGKLVGIKEYDSITFDDLVGLDYQKDLLISNTKAFTQRKKANNVLLYGDSGCGKSSSVKALLNLFQSQGLRIIEFPKNYLSELPELFSQLRSLPYQFIVFLDDLSFENDDINYKNLKVIMEGQLEQQSNNVLIYATSNRRHLITEHWTDRNGDDVHVNDTMQEKMSLSERFGINIVFVSPSQDEYLRITEELLKKENIIMTEHIRKEAIVWEMSYNGRNGRTAKQFVTNIAARENI